ncbi:MAG: spore maturation protein [Lachnospiraceae bacterium]
MKLLNFLSVFLIPFVLFYILIYGLLQKKPVFELFIKGGKQGFSTVFEIAPTIVGLLIAVGIFRSSGALDILCNILSPLGELFHISAQVIPLSVLKMFSASGANGLLFDIFKTYGTDSYIGFTSSILLSCTETLFYTVSVYYMSIDIKKTRWTVPAGILLSLVSLFISAWIAGIYLS